MDTKLRAINQLVTLSFRLSAENRFLDAVLHASEGIAEGNEAPFLQSWVEARQFLDSWNGTSKYQLPHAMRRTLSSTLVYYDLATHSVVLSPALLVPPFYYSHGTKAMDFGGLDFLLAQHLILALVQSAHSWSGNVSIPWLPLRQPDDELWRRRHQCVCTDDKSEDCFWFPSTPALDVLLNALGAIDDVAIEGMERFTAQQVLLITACHVTCKRESSPRSSTDNVRSFSSECNAAVRNLPAFAKAFRCPRGSNMNPVKKCAFF
ncbi:hypothetical protein HPB48_009310 [Haemaphysalis longicornis]|uniref:Peptidase M13 C-terminal domain-containing protein n=1 Tax=Haemaphysalis longicornis TaxID=44386 RepID=A0A9J6FWH8_HAELO|nr:hypothetical protein HPB48_009310 [Haemaphysalis longicornis]